MLVILAPVVSSRSSRRAFVSPLFSRSSKSGRASIRAWSSSAESSTGRSSGAEGSAAVLTVDLPVLVSSVFYRSSIGVHGVSTEPISMQALHGAYRGGQGFTDREITLSGKCHSNPVLAIS